MSQPRVSVLMPAYNAEKYIAQAVESILDQTFKNFELIIADDASTDGTWQIIKQYVKVDKRIHIYQNKTQLGIAATRNRLIKWSKASYIAWQDADDVSLSYRLQEQYSFIEKHPEVGMVGGNLYFFNENGNQSVREYAQDDKTLRSYIFHYSPVAQPVAMIRRECFEVCGYLNPKYIVASDLDMSFRLGMRYRFANIPKTLLYYRVHSESITSRKIRENELTTMHIRDLYKKTKQYKMKNLDKLFNLLQKFVVYVVPSHIKRSLFSFFRNNSVDKIYIPKTQFHLLKKNSQKPIRPLVSVIMPAYNAEKYIGEAIESILHQTFREFEFIIVDDASTDSTWSVIERYALKDKRIRTYRNRKNMKSCRNYIKAMNLAKGKYLAIMDNDDVSFPYRIEKQFEFLEKHPEVGIVGGTIEIIDNNGNYVAKRKYHLTDGDIRKNIFKYSPFAHPLVMIRKSVLEQIGYYNPEYAPADDYDLYFRIGKVAKFANLSDALLKYRVLPNSITNKTTRRMDLLTIKIRFAYSNNYPYQITLFDRLLALMQFTAIFFVPAKVRVWLFNLWRNGNK